MHRHRRYIEPGRDAVVSCSGRWGRRRVRVEECEVILAAEDAYTAAMSNDLKARQRTRDAMIRKAKTGHVTGGRVFGYDNLRVEGHVERRINEAEAAWCVGIL